MIVVYRKLSSFVLMSGQYSRSEEGSDFCQSYSYAWQKPLFLRACGKSARICNGEESPEGEKLYAARLEIKSKRR